MIRLCFLIRSLDRGGAERQLVELARALGPRRFRITILTFYSQGPLKAELAGTNVEVVPLEKTGRWDVGRFLARASRAIAVRRPHIVHGYLGIANEISWLLGRRCGARIVWGIRSSLPELS